MRFLWSLIPKMTLSIFRFSQIESDTDTKREITNITIGPLLIVFNIYPFYTDHVLTFM